MRYFLFASVLVAAACLHPGSGGAGVVLISEAEASLPAPARDPGETGRGLTRGPAIEQLSPDPESGPVRSPLSFKIRFVGRNKAAIDPASIKITYLKTPLVDLTSRLRTYVTADGVEVQQAEVPPGTHLLRFEITDSQGRFGARTIKLQVEK